MILFIKHIDIEGPETIGAFFEKHGFECRTIDLSLGEKLPEDLSSLEAVVCLGGPMNVYEEDKYPFLKAEEIFIKKVLKEQIPFLGICLGSQLLSKAAGGKVTRSPAEEIGWSSVDLTADGRNDLLFAGLGGSFEVFQWHGDMFSIPENNGRWLASGKDCPRQALKVGPCAYGFQFHIEITDKSIREWSDEYFKNDPPLLGKQKQSMLSAYEQKKKIFHQTGEKIFANFLNVVKSRKVLTK